MGVWIWGVIAVVVTAIIGWIKFGKLALLLAEIGQAIRATGDFLEDFAHKWEDKKLTPEEAEALGAKAQILWKEWKDVIRVFRK